ncbi:MAG: mycoredoxin [Marmoricola sp.]
MSDQNAVQNETVQDGTVQDPSTFTMYSTPWCGYCHRLKSQLNREGIEFEVVDIEQHPEAADLVMQVNNGNQTVPTLVYSDGSAQTNPSVAQVKAKLASLVG